MRKSIIIILVIIVLASFVLPRVPFSNKEALFRIEKGEGSKEISLGLQQQGLIWWSPLFRLYVLTNGMSGSLQAGTYQLSPSMNMLHLASKFTRGDIAKAKITIPEGFTAQQIDQKLQGVTDSSLVQLTANEGYLFPDTYEIPYGLPLEKVIAIMRDNFDRKTADLKITPDIVIMASLLEKELQTKEDKEMAASILWKRLRAGMPLQVDASLWTYQNRGLPEKPISNPGLQSIEAALHPQSSQYWYYLSTPAGKTIFSKTLEEHNIAKAKYLK